MTKKRGQNDGSIRQRKDGAYEARITMGKDPITGKQIQKSIYGKKKTDVMKKMRDILSELDKGIYIEPSDMTVGIWMNKWLTGFKKPIVRENTYKGYESLIWNHIQIHIGKVMLKNVKPSDIQQMYTIMMESGRIERPKKPKQYKNPEGKRPGPKPKAKKSTQQGPGNKTAVSVHRLLVEAFEQAIEEGLIAKNATKSCTPPKIVKREMKTLQSDELPFFLVEARKTRHFASCFTSVATRLRRGELLGLKWENVDLKQKKYM